MKNVLIICYSFPPFPGIGGRRWAKFAKYLAQGGYKVHVISAENSSTEESVWTKDVINDNIKTYPLPIKYPKALYNGTSGILSKISYRLWKLYLSFYSKGVVLERTIFWKKQLTEKATELIEKEGIKNVIISIPPYLLAAHAITLKDKYPQVNFIIDYRDPWTDNKSYHGFQNLSAERLAHEKLLEELVLSKADHILTVSDNMTETLQKRVTNPDKISTLLNGFDYSDITKIPLAKTDTAKTKFVYAGTLYSNLDYIVDPFLAYLQKLKTSNTPLYNSLSFEFYGNHNPETLNNIKQFDDKAIEAFSSIPLDAIQQKISECDFCVLMSAPDHSFAFNTKFYEYLANRKPILLFSTPGETSDFITKNQLGYFINVINIEDDLNYFLKNITAIKTNFNKSFDIEPYSVQFLAGELQKLLKQAEAC